ncbi:MAG: ribonuclease III [Lachnospiraceae bacterium]|nr:ribonuclease III [Lachnospiraceae bacterium]
MSEKRDRKDLNDFLEQMEEKFGISGLAPEQYSSLGLAYIVDAVYDMMIRTLVLGLGNGRVRNFHKITSSIVKAEAQAKLIQTILAELSEEELAVYKRGRNTKSATSAKNASIVDYRTATGLEALLGYLYLKHRMDRAMELVKTGLEETGQMPKHL